MTPLGSEEGGRRNRRAVHSSQQQAPAAQTLLDAVKKLKGPFGL